MDHGNRGSWPVVEYTLPESDWTVVIKYTYQHSDDDNSKTKRFCDAMDTHEPLGFAKDNHEREAREEGGEEE